MKHFENYRLCMAYPVLPNNTVWYHFQLQKNWRLRHTYARYLRRPQQEAWRLRRRDSLCVWCNLHSGRESMSYWLIVIFMYRRPILCTLYGAVDFLNVLKKGCWWGGVLLVHSNIYYVPVGDGWEEVLVLVLDFFGPKWHSLRSCQFRAQKSLDFQGPPLPMSLVMMLHSSKPLRTAP
jgi:hypothetical protein